MPPVFCFYDEIDHVFLPRRAIYSQGRHDTLSRIMPPFCYDLLLFHQNSAGCHLIAEHFIMLNKKERRLKRKNQILQLNPGNYVNIV